jgi:hypothetical protein
MQSSLSNKDDEELTQPFASTFLILFGSIAASCIKDSISLSTAAACAKRFCIDDSFVKRFIKYECNMQSVHATS